MCIACNQSPPPDWTIDEKRAFVADIEQVQAEEVTDELTEHYEALIGLEICFRHYGVLAVPQSYIEEHCCRNKST